MTRPTLRVVTHRNGMIEELTAGLREWTLAQHHGLSMPPEDGATLWMPGAYPAQARHCGARFAMSSPGPHHLGIFPPELLTRRISVRTVKQALGAPYGGFWKLADAKADACPAFHRTAGQLVADIHAAALPPECVVFSCDQVREFNCEYRDRLSPRAWLVLTSSLR